MGAKDLDEIEEVLDFWFGEIVGGEAASGKSAMWYSGGTATDELITEKFEGLLVCAGAGECDSWQEIALGSLALIIVLDQFPRNIYRKTGEAFAFGEKAVSVCHDGLTKGFDTNLLPVQLQFFYMPLMHSEVTQDQEKCVELFEGLVRVSPGDQSNLDYAIKHKKTIDEYGRYPYRNAVLGRESTPAELEYLVAHPETYGQ